MGTLGSGRYAPYAQRPHGRFVHHVEGHKLPEARNAPTFRALSGRILLRLAVGKACGRVKGGLNFGSRAQGN